jgi:hypothetical protein
VTGIPNRPAARSLPSRSSLATFRLIGYTRTAMRRDSPPVPGTLAIDSGQDTFETYTVAVWVLVATICYCAAILDSWLPLPLAFVLAVIATPIVLQIPFYATGLLVMPLWRRIRRQQDRSNVRANSFATMAVLLAASAWFATHHGFARGIAIASLVAAVLNAAAAPVMWLLRDRVRDMERRCAEPS